MKPIKWAEPYSKSAAWWTEPSGPPAPLLSSGFDWETFFAAIGEKVTNEEFRHCRIGKITLKQADKAV